MHLIVTIHIPVSFNLKTISSNLHKIWEFPLHSSSKTYEKNVLVIGGRKANYVTLDSQSVTMNFFPKARIEYLDTGHWVHAEKPREFIQHVSDFMMD